MDAAAHYRDLLSAHYTWMLGGDIEYVAAQDRRLLESLGVCAPAENGVALDLGCGPGPQSLALADLGFGTVVGIDSSRELLDELARLAHARPGVRTVHGDVLEVLPEVAAPGSVDVVTCMRDTVLHLRDLDAVDLLLTRVGSALTAQGMFVLTYRDLTRRLEGTDRFLPVRSDSDRIMLCALEYDSPDVVTVNDLIYTRAAGEWQLHKSSYPKLRISPDTLVERIEVAGLTVTHHAQDAGGLWSTAAKN